MRDIEWATGIDGTDTVLGTVRAGVLLRSGLQSHPGGVSFWPAGSHSPREVALTRRLFTHSLNRSVDDLRLIHQVHGTTVIRRTSLAKEEALSGIPTADAQFTADAGPVLIVNVADCCPVILASRDPALVGIAHAGWRGAAHGVVEDLLLASTKAGASLGRVRCWVGPCAEVSRYEVGPETAAHFHSWPGALLPHPSQPDKRLLNVRAVVVDQLLQAGVAAEHVTVSRGGTIGDRRYHSHRRSRGSAGRMAAFVTIG